MLILAYILVFLLVVDLILNSISLFKKSSCYSNAVDIIEYNRVIFNYNSLLADFKNVLDYVEDLEFENSELEEEVEQLLKLIPNGDTDESSDK